MNIAKLLFFRKKREKKNANFGVNSSLVKPKVLTSNYLDKSCYK